LLARGDQALLIELYGGLKYTRAEPSVRFRSGTRLRVVLAGSIALCGVAALLGAQSAALGSLEFPNVGGPWLLLATSVVFLCTPKSENVIPPLPLVLTGFLLVAAGFSLSTAWAKLRAPVSPLIARISRIGDDPRRLDVVKSSDSLGLPERRHLVRLAGERYNVSVDLRGFLYVPRDGTYRFEMSCDDRCRLFLGGKPVLETARWASTDVLLAAGISDFRLVYEQITGPAFLRLRWSRPDFFEPFPLDAYLGGDRQKLERASFRYQPTAVSLLTGLSLLWLVASSYILVRAGEAKFEWRRLLRAKALAWWREAPSGKPSSLVRERSWVLSSALFAASSAAARWRKGPWLDAAREEYSVNPQRLPYVLERIEAASPFLFCLAALCLAVAVALRWTRSRSGTRPSWHLLPPAIALALAWGAWTSQYEWVRYGRPCYDGYCDYAERVRDVLRSPGPPSVAALETHLRANYHANSPVGPLVIGALALWIPDVVTAYRWVSLAATLATLWLLARLASKHLQLAAGPVLTAAFLISASGSVGRSMLFPQTDALAMFFFTLSFERLLRLRQRFTAVRYVTSIVAIALALFSKLSAVPILGIAAAAVVWPGAREDLLRLHGIARGLARSAAVVLPPLALVAIFTYSFQTTENYRTEFHRISTLDSRASFHLVAAAVTLLPLLLSAFLTLRRKWTDLETLFAASVGIYLAGLWASGASGWERFYLNAMPMALPLAVSRLSRIPGIRPAQVAILLAAYGIAHGMRILFHLYNGA